MKLVAATALVLLTVAGPAAAVPQSTIVFTADLAPKLSGDIYRLDANGRRANLTNTPFVESSPAVAPRGGHVAYLVERDGRTSAWVVGLDGRGATRVTPWAVLSGSTGQLAWSPDGTQVAVLLGSSVYRAGAGRAPRVIARGSVLGNPAWSPDGRLVTFATGAYPDTVAEAVTASGRVAWRVPQDGALGRWSAGGLFAVPRAGRTTVYTEAGRPVFRFAGAYVAWSPNGARLASLAGSRVQVRDTNGRVLLSRTVAGTGTVAWLGNGSVLAGAFRIDVASGRVHAFSRLAWLYGSGGAYPVARGDAFAIVLGGRTFGRVPACMEDGARVPAISSLGVVPGGRSVVYASACYEPFANLFATSASGGPPHRLVDVSQQQGSVAVSPDGTQIAYTGAPATGLSCKGCPQTIWIANADGAQPRELTHEQECAFDANPSWSADGTAIVFARSTCETPPELMSVPLAGGAPADLHVRPADAAWEPKTARDGRVATARGRNHVTISANGTKENVVLPFAQVVSLDWSPDGSRFVVAARPKGGATFDVFTLRTNGTGVRRLTTNLDATSVSWG